MRNWLACMLGTVICAGLANGQAPRVTAAGETIDDSRFANPKTLDDHFPFVVPDNAGAWYARADALRRRVLVATGLWPMPEKDPLQPVIYGKVERKGFTVEKVYFQSLPGHFVTGLLFRPAETSSDPVPGVLCPHGHGGRMQRHSDDELAGQIAQGAEHFERSGRYPKLARCAQLARMGCVSFIFDMIGYADSVQIPRVVAHRHADPRPEELDRDADRWPFFSVQAELRLQSIMGLQTWNAIRALDFLASLPDVDPDRLAVTGGSGGGTQSILLGAVDQRIKVSFPNGMVSTAMQGGCYCENCNFLRIGTGNVELAALMAPRPQAMTAADDWTRDMMSDGYPELKWLYAMIGDENDVYCRPMLHFKHNYNYVARATMYQWMNRHLQLGLDDPVIEQDFEPLSEAETTIWSDQHPAPSEVGIPHERAVCHWFNEQANAKLSAVEAKDQESLAVFRKVLGGAWRVLFDQGLPTDISVQSRSVITRDGFRIKKDLIRDPNRAAVIPLLTIHRQGEASGPVVVWTLANGKNAAFDDQSGTPSEMLQLLVNGGATVMIPDLYQQGEMRSVDLPRGKQRTVDDKRTYSAFTFGYNRTMTAERSADLLTVIAHAAESADSEVHLLASAGTAAWAAPTAAIAGEVVSRAAIDTAGFRFAHAVDYTDATFVPGAVKYGDLPTVLALRAPSAIAIFGEAQVPGVVTGTYAASGANESALFSAAKPSNSTVVNWIMNSSN